MAASMIAREQIIYLDNNATTQLDPAVLEEMLPFLTNYFGNPSSGYTFGVQVRRAISNSFGFGGHNCCLVIGALS